jgi:hypothetical protein
MVRAVHGGDANAGALQRNFEGRMRVIPISVDSEGEREKAISALADAQRRLAALPAST